MHARRIVEGTERLVRPGGTLRRRAEPAVALALRAARGGGGGMAALSFAAPRGADLSPQTLQLAPGVGEVELRLRAGALALARHGRLHPLALGLERLLALTHTLGEPRRLRSLVGGRGLRRGRRPLGRLRLGEQLRDA